uniref:Uncharacterized protein LOC113785482 n=1 Tax=Cicer arietinum TaxID=3827 RepID=A0A3Q7Y8E5_CICAR|nr:uncharacterized protein LOC113785482 [Cicer arietinum]
MPPKKKMENKVHALENRMSTLEVAIVEMRAQAAADQERLISLITPSKDMGDSVKQKGEGDSNHAKDEQIKKLIQKMQGEKLDEFRQSVKKIELPMFTGDDPASWIGSTLYGGLGDGSVFEQLSSLKYECSVEEYIKEFERLVAQVGRLPEAQFVGYFIHGLCDGIRGRVRSLKALGPVSRAKLMNLARVVEAEVQEKGIGWNGPRDYGPKGSRSGLTYRSNPNFGTGSTQPGRAQNNDWAVVKGSNDGGEKGGNRSNQKFANRQDSRRSVLRDRGIRYISAHEIAERRQKNMCFKCGGAYHPRHQCPDRQLRVMVMEEDDDGEMQVLAADTEEEDGEGVELSIMSLAQIDNSSPRELGKVRTIKLKGRVQGVPLLVLVDSGARHNFISHKLVRSMGWPVEGTTPLNVKMGDGFKVVAQGVCRKLVLDLGSMTSTIDAWLFDLDGIDIVLGMSWLASIGGMWVDWAQKVLHFPIDSQWVELRGEGIEHNNNQLALQSLLGRPKLRYRGMFLSARAQGEPKGLKLRKPINDSHLNPALQIHELVAKYSKNEIENQIRDLLLSGVIRPSQSAFSSPVILMKKKDGSWRMCVDYRALNKVTIPDKFPIPVIDELLDELYGAHYFSKLDLKSGYHQVRVKTEDVHKTAFRTHEGHYEYLVMPFGLMNAPSTFQALMNDIFKNLLRKYVLVFFDVILVYIPSLEDHFHHVSSVLDILQQQGLVANRKKYSFAEPSVEYLGHIISSEGVAMDPAKVLNVLQWPTPKNVKGVRGFLGLTGYYRKFIKDYGKMARPLTELTKRDNFKWGEGVEQAFQLLKQKVTFAPVLALPDFQKEFFIESDASGNGLGAILIQEGRPIAYFSKALGEGNLTKSAYEKELMAVALAIQHWRPYLVGRKFTVCTDQKSLK